MVRVVRVLEGVRDRRVGADEDGGAARETGRTAVPAARREEVVRLGEVVQSALLQLVLKVLITLRSIKLQRAYGS